MINKQTIKEYGIICLIALIVLVLAVAVFNLNKSTITGFAVKDKNKNNETINESTASSTEATTTNEASINETTTTINETLAEESKEKPEKEKKAKGPNVPPVWKSNVGEFTLYGKTVIDLNNYFSDDNNDTLTYSSTTPEKISAAIETGVSRSPTLIIVSASKRLPVNSVFSNNLNSGTKS